MAKNPLFDLQEHGTSVWYDNIRRSLITSGELHRMIQEDAVVGMTSNPTIFEKAIGGSSDYDDSIRKLLDAGTPPSELMLSLWIEDVQLAADVLRPVYERTDHVDGYVSIEVLPELAADTDGTIRMAHDLFDRVGRPNIFVKIPATPAGLPAIEQCIGDGININITLIFARQVYEQVAEAYLRGLQRRLREGKPADVASVASFFVSRVDTAVDKLLEEKIAASQDDAERRQLQSLLGKAAIANARLAYRMFQQIFHGDRFAPLREQGARVQRPLWASTGTKNPHYSDVLYVEELIGPQTVNTMPHQTLTAFKDHGEVRPSLTENIEGAEDSMRRLAAVGIDIDTVTQDLQVDGVKLFADSVTKLREEVAKKVERLRAGRPGPHQAQLGALEGPVRNRVDQIEREAWARRVWEKDASLWTSDPAAQREVKDRLGWLRVVDQMEEQVPRLNRLRDALRGEGYTDAVLLGMGGSSLAPEVLRQTFGTLGNGLTLHVLDTTDPAAIIGLQESIDVRRTVFVVASKSGTTLETQSHYHYFWEQAGRSDQFLAITDPDTPLAQDATARHFREVFLNPSDIGGRYSALSYFGLVPAALAGIDVARLLDRAAVMEQACAPSCPVAENPGAWLGAVLGEAWRAGRDKITILAPPAVGAFGLWAEQLLAESTGKRDRGLIPIADEPVGSAAVYGKDRLFVRLALESDPDWLAESGAELAGAGHPVVTLRLRDALDLGAEFFRWEYATAVAGAVLEIDAFDQPNVQEAKDLTQRVLSEIRPATVGEGISWAGTDAETLDEAVEGLLAQVRPGDYVALLAYAPPADEHTRALTAIRVALRDRYRVATTAGYGPRYLHSTGQLHKGGPNTGVFIQVVGDDPRDLQIPGLGYGFGVLKQAQAIGDYRALRNHRRRVLRIQTHDVRAGLAAIAQAVGASVEVR